MFTMALQMVMVGTIGPLEHPDAASADKITFHNLPYEDKQKRFGNRRKHMVRTYTYDGIRKQNNSFNWRCMIA